MTCQPTNVPPLEAVDIPALRAKYSVERDKRFRSEGQTQYFRPTGGVADDYSKDPHLPVKPRDAISEELDVVVLGGGFGGLLASVHLTKAGITNFRNVDTAGDFGGVWYWNRYPGIQCDNDAYCYLPLLEETGFLPSQKFSDGEEIYSYCKLIANKFGFADQALFHTHINHLKWDEASKRWDVKTDRGDHLRAKFVIMACGVLNMPKLPAVNGIDKFKGRLFHTARWDYSYTGGSYENPTLDRLGDKKVAIIGTGATAIQAVPHLAKFAEQLYVIQRTPSTVDERPNPKTDPEWQASLTPGWQQDRIRNFHHGAQETYAPGEADLICDIWTEINRNLSAEFEAKGWPANTEEYVARREEMDFRVMERLRHRVEALIDDPETAESLKPWYRHLCKRPLSSNNFYPAFNQPNVSLIDVAETKGLQEITETGFVANGQEYEADCLIFASGFETTSDLDRRWGIDVIEGRDNISLYDHWRQGPTTFHGTMTNNFPNQFFIGYIQGGLNSSVTEQFGEQGRHIAHIIAEALKQDIKSVEPSPEAVGEYVRRFRELEIDMSDFQTECTPGYFNNEGEDKPNWTLFRAWGLGWDNFQEMVAEWRDQSHLPGMIITR